MISWRIYYADGDTFDSGEGSEFDAPRAGVLAIVSPEGCCHGFDYYRFENGRWFGGDLYGAFEHMQRADRPLVLFGRYIATPEFKAILERAMRDDLQAPVGVS